MRGIKMRQKTNFESFTDTVKALNETKAEGSAEVDMNTFYLGEIAMFMAIISDEIHEANRLKKVEIEQMKKRKI